MQRSTAHEFYQDEPRPVSGMAKSYAHGYLGYLHSHTRAQLLYAESGTMKVTTERGSWIVPSSRAVWFPPNYPHQTSALSALEMRALYIRPDACPEGAPDRPCVISVSPLLRELIRSITTMPLEYDEHGRDGRVVSLLLDEIDWSPVHSVVMPVLRDERLQAIERVLSSDPGDTRTLEEWAAVAAASPRTLARLFLKETGMSFRCWRDQFRALTALPHLTQGAQITTLAAQFGYETPGAFAAMFKRVMGVTPSEYLAESKTTTVAV